MFLLLFFGPLTKKFAHHCPSWSKLFKTSVPDIFKSSFSMVNLYFNLHHTFSFVNLERECHHPFLNREFILNQKTSDI